MLQVDEHLPTGEELTDDDIIELVTNTESRTDGEVGEPDDAEDDDDDEIQVCQSTASTHSMPKEISLNRARRSAETLVSYFEQLSEHDNTEGINCAHKIFNILNSRADSMRQSKVTEFFK